MKAVGLEQLREMLSDDKVHLEVGTITSLELEDDRSQLFCGVLVLAWGLELNARMSWDAVGPEAGVFQFPAVNDLVIVAFMDGNEDEAFVVRRLTSKEDKIPLAAVDGNLVLRALTGRKNFVVSDTEINLVRGDNPGNEKLVLGDTFQAAYSEHLQETSIHKHIGNLGYLVSPPDNAAKYSALKASPVDDNAMLSDLAKTEK